MLKHVIAAVAALASAAASAQELPAPAADNRLTLLVGYGPDGMRVEQTGRRRFAVEPYMGPLAGVSYSRRIWAEWSATAQVMTGSPATRTFIGTIGVGFDW